MPNASRLFSPLTVGRARFRNRIVMEALPSGRATLEGFVDQKLQVFYRVRARGGAGAVVIEPARVTAPADAGPHLGLHADVHVPGMRDCISGVRDEGCAALIMLDQPGAADDDLATLVEAFTLAAWRARAAGADGVMLSTADLGPFHHLSEPSYGEQRLRAMLTIIEAIVAWLGRRFVVGVRLGVEEHMPGGLSLQDARVAARRLTSAGANLIEVAVRVGPDTPLAQFPGWCVPVASALRAVVEVPVLVGGQLDDPELAEMTIEDGEADLVAVGERLLTDPRWPEQALAELQKGGRVVGGH